MLYSFFTDALLVLLLAHALLVLYVCCTAVLLLYCFEFVRETHRTWRARPSSTSARYNSTLRPHTVVPYAKALLSPIKALLRLYEGSTNTLLRLYQPSSKALLRLYYGSLIQALLMPY